MRDATAPLFVAIGASGGDGFDDIKALVQALGHPLRAVIMVVLHRPSQRISVLRDMLAGCSAMPVVVAAEATVLEPGRCYIGAPAAHLALIRNDPTHLVARPDGHGDDRTLDTVFESLATRAPAHAIGVVWSGLLDAGSRGLAAIRAAGGLTMVLDPDAVPDGTWQNTIDGDGPISFIGSALQIAHMVQQVTGDGHDPVVASHALILTDAESRIVGWNAGAVALFGWSLPDVSGRSSACLFASDDDQARGAAVTIPGHPPDQPGDNGGRWCIRRDGSRFWADSIMLSQASDGLSGLVVILRDDAPTTQAEPDPPGAGQIAAEPVAAPTEAHYRLLSEMIPQLVWRSLDDGDWDWAGPQWVAYTGQAEPDSLGQGWRAMVHPDDQAVTVRAWEMAAGLGGLDIEHRLRRADGVYRWFQTRAAPLQGEGAVPGPRRWFGTSTDIDSLREAEQRNHFLARHDVLTGAGNRALLQEVLEQAIARNGGDDGWCTLLCVDIDRFRGINDQLGHRAGDELLRQVAAELRGCLRQTDLLARIGGDEFVLVQGAGTTDEATGLVMKVGRALSGRFVVHGQNLTISASVGVASCQRDGSPDELLQRAELALSQAKMSGGGCIRFFEPDMEAELRRRHQLERDLREAIEHDALDVHYQPIFTAVTGALAGYEALVRWTHPEYGAVPPDLFIPLAEESGLIMTLGEQMLRKACAAAAGWAEQVRIAVNVSPAQFRGDDLPREVAEVLDRTGLAASRLELEVTEGLLLQNSPQLHERLQAIRAQGVRIVLDDFGNGYSNLGYFCRFPFDKVKIDRSFIQNMETDAGSRAVIKAVVALADSLHLEVTAEGVETDAQLAMLRGIGCTQVQGFLLGRPAPL